MRAGLLLPSLILFCLAGGRASAEQAASGLAPEQVEFFESRIRPVLVERCYQCHAAESAAIKGGLRLDNADGWRQGGDSGPAVLPGKPEESLLIQSLRYESYEMPPDGQLAANVIADFERWVRMGAPDPRSAATTDDLGPRVIDLEAGREFWSFQPLTRSPTPEVRNKAWPRTWIDRFILSAEEAVELAPAADLDAEPLLRRLSFDLTGLPPSVEELQAFRYAADEDVEAAIADAVDRLLESPEFGAHWGRHWLDVARYADSNGGDFNATFHDAWRYREYVIRNFNEDRPFDRFIREQIAGDLLPAKNDAEREEHIVATGFLAVGPKMLSERDKDKLRMDVVDEQINTVGQAFLGMTLGCARCHDHKFDPIPTTDYYALAGIFRSTQALDGESQKYVSDFARTPLPIDPAHAAALARYKEDVKEVDQRLAAAKKRLTKLKEALAASSLGVTVDDAEALKVGNWTPSTNFKRFIGAGYVHDNKQSKGELSITFTPDLPSAGDYEVRFAFAASGGRDRQVPVRIRHAGGETVVTVDQVVEPPIDKLWAPLGRFSFEAGRGGSVTVSNEGTTDYVIADAMQFIPVAELESNAATMPAPEEVAAQQQLQAEIKQLEEEQQALKKSAPPRAPTAIAVRDAEEIGDCALCIRGEHNRRGDAVPRGVLQVALYGPAPQFPSDASGRLELANWIADSHNPLTARVFVNRVWAHLLGEGLVRTVDNFGRLGQVPSHPELLDRLALDFIAHDWSVKHLIREILLSHVYRQQSTWREEAFRIDPENRLLWRAHRKRLPAESIRDTLLAVSGKLDATRGGAPVEGLGTLVTNNNADAQTYKSGQSAQRSVYLPIIRNELPTMLSAFDFADPDFVTGRRTETNVPAQALVLMNSPFVRESSQLTAERMAREASGDDAGRIAWLYEAILSRRPTTAETDRAILFIEALRREHTRPEETLVPWSRLVHVLFASTEFRLLD